MASTTVITSYSIHYTKLYAIGWSWLAVVTGFVAFRVFDVWKPGPVRRAERLAGGAGVMLDDVVAGAFAAPVVAVVARVLG